MLKLFEKLVEVFTTVQAEKNVLYVELDLIRYNALIKEIDEGYNLVSSIDKQKVPDFGECTILTYMGYKFIVSCNTKLKTQQELINIGFKIRPDDGIQDSTSSQT
jgi:hypothetical protein